MDLRRFPHLAEELGLKGEFTAHAQKGASVSRAMPKTAFHVSPTGDDAADGSAARPFRTLARARAAVRSLKAEGLPPGGVAVKLRGGVYKASETFELKGEADSGTPDRPIVWCAEGDDMPVFEGGFDVPPLKPVTDAAALARIPAAARAHVLCCDVRTAGYKHVAPQGQYGYYCGVVPVTDFFQDVDQDDAGGLPPVGRRARSARDGLLEVVLGGSHHSRDERGRSRRRLGDRR